MCLSLFVFDAHSLVLCTVLVWYHSHRSRHRYKPGHDWFSGLQRQLPNLIVIAVRSRTRNWSSLSPLKQFFFAWIRNLFPSPKRRQRRFKVFPKSNPSRGIFGCVVFLFQARLPWFSACLTSMVILYLLSLPLLILLLLPSCHEVTV